MLQFQGSGAAFTAITFSVFAFSFFPPTADSLECFVCSVPLPEAATCTGKVTCGQEQACSTAIMSSGENGTKNLVKHCTLHFGDYRGQVSECLNRTEVKLQNMFFSDILVNLKNKTKTYVHESCTCDTKDLCNDDNLLRITGSGANRKSPYIQGILGLAALFLLLSNLACK